MQTIRFVSNDLQQQRFAEAVRKNVSNYFREKGISTKGNIQVGIQTIIMISAYVIPFVLILTVPMSAWVAFLMWVIMGIGTAGIGMSVMHSAAHGSYSEKEWINKFFAGTMYALGGNVYNWKMQHNISHHTYTNIEEFDPDIVSKGPLRFSEHTPVQKIHRYQYILAFFLYGFMTIFKIFGDFPQMIKFNREGFAKKFHINPTTEYIKLILIKLIYFFVMIGLPVLLTSFSLWQVLLGFLIMHWITGLILGTIFQMAHVVEGAEQPMPNAEGIMECDWAVHELRTTADFARNNLFLFWYIGGLNFQIEHHLFPSICHVHYRNIAPIVEKTATEFGYSYNLKPTFIQAILSHIKRLKELGKSATGN